MLLMIDNYDSFTYNLVQYFAELGEQVEVYRNDEIAVSAIAAKKPTRIVLSPGPCTPKESGICKQVIQQYAGEIPLLGVCLGHQCIGEVYGGEVVGAGQIMHGKTSMLHHDGSAMYADMPMPFQATRYHSLVVRKESLPDCLTVNSWTLNAAGEPEEIMGFSHQTLPVYGLQFHPESILTPQGKQLLQNFISLSS